MVLAGISDLIFLFPQKHTASCPANHRKDAPSVAAILAPARRQVNVQGSGEGGGLAAKRTAERLQSLDAVATACNYLERL